MVATDQERLRSLQARAVKLGYQVRTSMDGNGYCLWRVLPALGRYLILGHGGGVTINAIEEQLDTIAKDQVTAETQSDKLDSRTGKKDK